MLCFVFVVNLVGFHCAHVINFLSSRQVYLIHIGGNRTTGYIGLYRESFILYIYVRYTCIYDNSASCCYRWILCS